MTKQPSPAQIKAREAFAAKARSGAFKRTRKAAPKRKRNPRAEAMNGAQLRTEARRAAGVLDWATAAAYYDAAADWIEAHSSGSSQLAKRDAAALRQNAVNARSMIMKPSSDSDRYMVAADVLGRRQFVVGARVSSRDPVLGAYANAAVMTAARAAIVKSRLDAMGYPNVEAIPVETVDFAASTPGKLHDNPRDLHNIERSGFHTGAHVGYGGGAVWTITKATKRGEWLAIPRQSDAPEAVRSLRLRGSLASLSEQLAALDVPKANPRKRNAIVLSEKPVRRVKTATHVEVLTKPASSRDVVLWTFNNRESPGAFKSFKLPARVARSPDFQAWVRGNAGVLSDTYAGLRKRIARFAIAV